MSLSPPVSVLMPVYNCDPYLDEAIASIRGQTFTDFELVIVNDGSTDGSLKTLRRHAAKDARLKVIDQPNGGIVSALNAGLAFCRGRVVARMDGDDVALPHRLASQVDYLNEHPDCVACGTEVELIDEAGRSRGRGGMPIDAAGVIGWCLSRGICGIIHPTLAVRRTVLQRVGGYREFANLAEDLDLLIRLARIGPLANVAEPGLLYRQRPGQTCHPYNLRQTRAVIAVLERAAAEGTENISEVVAAFHRKASWQATDTGRPLLGLVHATKAMATRPLRQNSWRTFGRSLCYARPYRRAT